MSPGRPACGGTLRGGLPSGGQQAPLDPPGEPPGQALRAFDDQCAAGLRRGERDDDQVRRAGQHLEQPRFGDVRRMHQQHLVRDHRRQPAPRGELGHPAPAVGLHGRDEAAGAELLGVLAVGADHHGGAACGQLGQGETGQCGGHLGREFERAEGQRQLA
jgi:hypothetical protein